MSYGLKKEIQYRDLGECFYHDLEQHVLEEMEEVLTNRYCEEVAKELMQYVHTYEYESTIQLDYGDCRATLCEATFNSTWYKVTLESHKLNEDHLNELVRKDRQARNKEYMQGVGF